LARLPPRFSGTQPTGGGSAQAGAEAIQSDSARHRSPRSFARQGSGHAPLEVLPRCCAPRLPRDGLLLSPLRDPSAGAVVRDWVCCPWLALAELRLPRGFPAERHRPARLSEGIARALATDHTMPGADITAYEQVEPPALIEAGPVKGGTSLLATQHLLPWCGHLRP
jgi:hypothetical protein